ncbi:MAG: hypothetical protein ACXAB4_06565 [Candidatus Hodarchaeales archaeon]
MLPVCGTYSTTNYGPKGKTRAQTAYSQEKTTFLRASISISPRELLVAPIFTLALNGEDEGTMQETNYTRMVKDLFAPFRVERTPEPPAFWKIVIEAQVSLLGSDG